jgi:membrane protein implicated in regulation of membrane protease activity
VGVSTWARDDLRGAVFGVATLAIVAASIELRARAARRNGRTVANALYRGRAAIVEHACSPTGRVRVDGTSWAAKSVDAQALQPGEQVYVHDGEGLVLHVSRRAPPA